MSADCARASSRTRRLTRPRLTLIACWTVPPPMGSPSSLADCIEVITSAVAMSVLDGTQSVSTAAPPSPSRSMRVTSPPT